MSAAGLVTAAGLAGCKTPAALVSNNSTNLANSNDLQQAGPQADPPQQVSAPRPDGVLGANFNGDPKVMTYRELQAVDAKWVRGFFAMPDADHGNAADQPAIHALLGASEQGYGTVLSLKFPYFDQPIPAPGSPEMAAAERRMDAVCLP